MFRLLAMLGLLCAVAGAQASLSVEETRALGVQSTEHELLYLGSQRKYTCMYQVTVRTYHANHSSQPPVVYSADLFSSNTGQVLSDLVPRSAPAQVPAGHQLRVTFPTDILLSVLQHSVLEDIRTETPTGGDGGTGRTFVRFTFRGDPAFLPASYTDRVAHVLSGRMILDATDALLVLVNGVAAEDAVDETHLLVAKGVPILDFHAALFKGVFLPLRFSAASFVLVPKGPSAEQQWNEHLTRSFGDRQSCEESHVHSTVRGAIVEQR